jgi:hypothetical protein
MTASPTFGTYGAAGDVDEGRDCTYVEFCCCHTMMKVLLHCCCNVVTLLLHCSYTVVTLFIHGCYTVLTLLLNVPRAAHCTLRTSSASWHSPKCTQGKTTTHYLLVQCWWSVGAVLVQCWQCWCSFSGVFTTTLSRCEVADDKARAALWTIHRTPRSHRLRGKRDIPDAAKCIHTHTYTHTRTHTCR